MFDFESLRFYVELYGQLVAYLMLFGIIFAETGLLVGFFLPGDSLLFTAGVLSSLGYLDIFTLCSILFIAAVAGDSVGYAFGHKVGKKLFRKEDSPFFHKDHLIKAKSFYEKHGGKTIVLARFMPIIRTFAPVIAGVGDMQYPKFLLYNVLGGVLWAICIPVAGFYFGKLIPEDKLDVYLLPIIALIILASIAPGLYHGLKTKEQRTQFVELAKALLLRLNGKSS